MYYWIRMMGLEGICYVLAVLPFLAAWCFWVSRKKNVTSRPVFVGFWIFTGYLCGVAAVTGLPTLQYLTFDPSIQLVPLHELRADAMQYLLNIILFIPAGFLLPLLWEKYGRLGKTTAFGFLLSLLIECSQLFCLRTTDLNDLFTNTLGAVLGWLIWRGIIRGKSLDAKGSSPWQMVGLVWATAFFLETFISGFIWERLWH